MVVYIAQEVRDERFAIFAELLTRYDTDGVEVDLSLNNEYVLQYASHAVKFFNVARPPAMNKPLWRVHLPMVTLALLTDECARGRFGPLTRLDKCSTELAPVLTSWLRDLRKVADAAQTSQGRRKRVYVRIPAAAEQCWAMLGMSVKDWVDEEIVDGLIVLSSVKKQTPEQPLVGMDQDLHLAPVVEMCHDTECRVLAGFTTHLNRPQASEATPPMIFAAALNCWAQGVDGFGVCETKATLQCCFGLFLQDKLP